MSDKILIRNFEIGKCIHKKTSNMISQSKILPELEMSCRESWELRHYPRWGRDRLNLDFSFPGL